MAKLTKQQLSRHKLSLELVNDTCKLSDDERVFVLENWQPAAADVTGSNAIFTPPSIAQVVALDTIDEGRLLDLCAGIGSLAFHVYQRAKMVHWEDRIEIVAIEKNPEFAKVGKRILPEATWITGSIFDQGLMRKLGRFDSVISNPPFEVHKGGQIGWLKFRGATSLMAVEVALRISVSSLFILAQHQVPWKYSDTDAFTSTKPSIDNQRFNLLFPQLEWMTSAYGNIVSGQDFRDSKVPIELAHISWPWWNYEPLSV